MKRAAQDSLDWLWEWYWSQLDYAFATAKKEDDDAEVEGIEAVREKLQGILKTYVRERKSEIKTRKKESKAAEHAISTYNLRYAPSSTSTPSARTQIQLLRLLVVEKMILPTDKKLGSSMSGAFLIWDPLLLAFCQPIIPVSTMLTHMMTAMSASSASRAMITTEMDPVKEGLYEWILHLLRSEAWQPAREQQTKNLVEDTLITCFSEPTHWNLKIAEALLQDEDVPNREQWLAVLEAATSETDEDVQATTGEEMDVDVEEIKQGLPVATGKSGGEVKKEKIRGPQKFIGMWIPRPIGWIPEGWEDDE